MHEEGSKLEKINVRPIALLPSISKIFERIKFNRIYDYLEKFEFNYNKQFGYRMKYGTIDAIEELTEKLEKSISIRKSTLQCCSI